MGYTTSNQCNSWKSLIGIMMGDNLCYGKKYFTAGDGYGFVGSASQIVTDGGSSAKKYGEKLEKVGNVIEVILELNDVDGNTLSYVINGKDYGKAFDIPPCKGGYDWCGYRLAVSFVD